MAKKEEMEFEIMRTIFAYEDMLPEAKLSKVKIFSWMEEMCATYENLRKAYKFIHGPFLKELKAMHLTWKLFKNSVWQNMKELSPGSKEVKTLKVLAGNVKYQWSQRPKPSRKR